jgi:hypothetical protein
VRLCGWDGPFRKRFVRPGRWFRLDGLPRYDWGMNARMFGANEIRGVADRDLAEVPQANFVGEVKGSQPIDGHLAAAQGVTV